MTQRLSMKSRLGSSRAGLVLLVSAVGLAAAAIQLGDSHLNILPAAHAADDGSEAMKKGGKSSSSGHSDTGHGGEKGQKDNLTKGPTSSRGDYDASGQGPRGASGQTDTRGTKPVWASEGVTVELGRLNVIRAPQSVRDRQLAEALSSATATPELMTVYSWSIEQFAANLTDDTVRLDAPLANLAMYEAFVEALAKNPTATSVTIRSLSKETQLPVSYTFNLTGTATPTSVLGIMLGTAADKDVTKIGGLDAEVVEAVNLILGVTADFSKLGISTTDLGLAAETVRSTISVVHGE